MDDEKALRPPPALPAGERMVRWEDDAVVVEGREDGLLGKLSSRCFFSGIARKKGRWVGTGFGEDVVEVGEAEEVV